MPILRPNWKKKNVILSKDYLSPHAKLLRRTSTQTKPPMMERQGPPSAIAGGARPPIVSSDDGNSWERSFIDQIKTLKSGSKDQLESLTDLATTDASKRYKLVVNVVSKYSQTMKPKYRPSMMYVISSLVMHENAKVASLYRQRFAIEISVLVEKICECRTEQLATVRRNIERWREKECFESLVLDECEYHVQKFEEAGREAEEEERRKLEDGLLGMERIETPPPPEEEEEEEPEEEKKAEEESEKPTTTVNKWPKLIPAARLNNTNAQQQKKQNKKRKRNSEGNNNNKNHNNNREKFTNGSFRQQQQQKKPPMNQQQKQQSQHGQGKPTKTQKRRMNRKKGDKNGSNNNFSNHNQQQQQEKGGAKDDQQKISITDRLS